MKKTPNTTKTPGTGSDTPLRARVEGDQLVIRIGVERLAWAALRENGGPLKRGMSIESGHEEEFAKDVAAEMERDDDLGNTSLSRYITKTMRAAVDEGSGAVVYPPKS